MKVASLFVTFLLFSRPSLAAEFTFTSPLDRFVVEVNDGSAYFNGEEVNPEPFAYVKPLFDIKFLDLCEKGIGRPDLTIVRTSGGLADEKRLVYIEKKIISDGQNCGSVTGHGLYQLPLHRNWFDGKKSVTIALGDSFSIWKNGSPVVEFTKTARGWRNKNPKFFTNWQFFEKFVSVLREFPVDFRVHPLAAKTLTTFELHQGHRKFIFVKVGEKTWAVQFPGSPWLAASGRFGLFEDMRQEIWESPYAKSLKIVSDITAKPDVRVKAVREISSYWGTDIKYVFHDVMLMGDDNLEVRKEISNVLRSKPTDENFKILIDSLKAASDLNFQAHISKILRLRNPKGPAISEDDEASAVQEKLNAWLAWRKTLN